MSKCSSEKRKKTDVYESTSALCPFYRGEVSCSVVCEEVTDRSSVKLTFVRSEDQKQHLYRFCYNDFSSCRVCGMLNGKYE